MELHDLINVLITSPETAPLIDEQRIGVLGVGPGGTAALLLAGARLDKHGWNAYCVNAASSDPYCTPWTEPLMADLVAKAHLGKPYRDTRVRAAVAVAPGYGMLLTQKGLSGVTPPVLILRADMDTINRAPHHADAIHNALPKQRVPNVLDVLYETDTASLMANCSPAMQQTLPELCAAATPARRERSYTQLSEKSIQFFLTQLGAIASAPRTTEQPLEELNAPPPPTPPKPLVPETPKPRKSIKNLRGAVR